MVGMLKVWMPKLSMLGMLEVCGTDSLLRVLRAVPAAYV